MDRRDILRYGAGVGAAMAWSARGWSADQPTLQGRAAAAIAELLTLQDHALQANRTPALLSVKVAPRVPFSTADRLVMWHDIGLDANARDYVKPAAGTGGVYNVQFGPHRSSRAIAIVQIAVFEAVNAKLQRYKSYTGLPPVHGDVSLDAAIAYAAHDALIEMYPPQKLQLNSILSSDAIRFPGSAVAIDAGRKLGQNAAASILKMRANDNSGLKEPEIPMDYHPSHAIGEWDQDPVKPLPVALGGQWGKVTPFILQDAKQLRPKDPPAVDTAEYTVAYNRTKMLGGDPDHGTKTVRNDDQTFIAKLWSYDGTPGLCAPCRNYNQIARQLGLAHGVTEVGRLARFLAVVNVALADAGISAWEAKYHFKFWRPVTAIRRADDGNPATKPAPNWYPLGAQQTNTTSPNITPPFPAYPSGHAVFGGALFQVLRAYMPDQTRFSYLSDEYNGKNLDVTGKLRGPRWAHFTSLTDAERSNALSRIYNGVHWQFDGDNGIIQGNQVSKEVLSRFARKVA